MSSKHKENGNPTDRQAVTEWLAVCGDTIRRVHATRVTFGSDHDVTFYDKDGVVAWFRPHMLTHVVRADSEHGRELAAAAGPDAVDLAANPRLTEVREP